VSYSTVEQLRMVLTGGATGLTDPPNPKTNTAADLPNETLSDAIDEADGMIDAALAGRYETPVGTPTTLLKSWSRSIAAYLATCIQRKSADFADNDPIVRRYRMTADLLDKVSRGTYVLNLPANTVDGTTSAGAGDPINLFEGDLFDGTDLDLGPSWGDIGYPWDGRAGAYGRTRQLSVDAIDAMLRGMQ